MLLLGINTATKLLSLTLSSEKKIIECINIDKAKSHSRMIVDSISDLLKRRGKLLQELDGIAVNLGPGSFTGLRIGVSTAKGLTFSNKIKLFACNFFEEIITNVIESNVIEKEVSIILNSRKDEFYATKYFVTNEKIYFNDEIILVNLNNINDFVKNSELVILENDSKYLNEFRNQFMKIFLIEANSFYTNLVIEKEPEKYLIKEIDLIEPLYIKNFIPLTNRGKK